MIKRRSQNAEAAMGCLFDGVAWWFEWVAIVAFAVVLLVYWLLS